MFLLFGIIPI